MWGIWKSLFDGEISKALFDEDYAREQYLIAERAENERKTAARVEKAKAEAEKKEKAKDNELALKLLL